MLETIGKAISFSEYHMLYFFLISMCCGIYRIYDAKQRVLFEQQPDERVNSIPDSEVVELWHNLSKLNIKFARFFKPYGWFIAVGSFLNILLFFSTNISFRDILRANPLFIIVLAILSIVLVVGFFVLGENGRNPDSQSFMLTFQREKKKIFSFYINYEFAPRSKWSENVIHFDGRDWHIMNEWIGKERHILIGSIMLYSSWLLLFSLITIFHLIFFMRY